MILKRYWSIFVNSALEGIIYYSPSFILLAFFLSPFRFLSYCDFELLGRNINNRPLVPFSIKWLQISLGSFSKKSAKYTCILSTQRRRIKPETKNVAGNELRVQSLLFCSSRPSLLIPSRRIKPRSTVCSQRDVIYVLRPLKVQKICGRAIIEKTALLIIQITTVIELRFIRYLLEEVKRINWCLQALNIDFLCFWAYALLVWFYFWDN